MMLKTISPRLWGMGISDAIFCIYAFFIAKVLATWYFYCFNFAVICKSINSEINSNEINLHTLYSATLVQLMFISFNTMYPEWSID